MWIKRHWLGFLGGLVFAWGPLVKAIGWGLDLVGLGGSIDFVISRTSDPGWVGSMFNWLLDPPGWVVFPSVVVATALIWWNLRRARPGLARQGAHSETRPAAVELPQAMLSSLPFSMLPGTRSYIDELFDEAPIDLSYSFERSRQINDDIVVVATIKVREGSHNVALIGRSADQIHTLSGAHWEWHESVRLKDLSQLYESENLSYEVVRRPRSGENIVYVFGKKILLREESHIILTRTTAIYGDKKVTLDKAYHLRRFGDTLILDPIDMNDISYTTGLDN